MLTPDAQSFLAVVSGLVGLTIAILTAVGSYLAIRKAFREAGALDRKDAAESITAKGDAAVSLSNAAAKLVEEIQANAAQQVEELTAQLENCYRRIEALEVKEDEHETEIIKLKARLVESEQVNIRLEEENAALRIEMKTMQEKVERLRVVNATLLAQNGDLKKRLKEAGLWQAENGKS